MVDVYGLHELYLANATNDVVAGWTTAVRNEFAKVVQLAFVWMPRLAYF